MSRARTNALSTRLLGLAAITLLAAPAVRAQVSVEFKVAAREVYANEAVLASLEVHNFQTCEEPAFPDIEGCTVQQRGEGLNSRFTQIVGGRITETRKRVYEYELTPTRVGTLLIPAIPVNVDGQTMKTRPVRLTVRPSNAAELFFAEITIDKRRVYIGEEVPATMTLWIKPARYGRRWRGANDMLNRVWAPNLGPFPKQIANANDVRRRRTVNGVDETFYAFDFVAEIPILQVGTLRFDDSALGIAYPAEGGTRHLRTTPTAPGVEALPVPMEGRPATFAGAVGIYDIETYAEPRDVRVGDPIELTIELYGKGPVETLAPPLLLEQTALTSSFRVPDEALAGENDHGRRRFTVTIRAQDDGVTAIPPIEYPYFDPYAEEFVIARSDPIELNVAPAVEIATPDIPTEATPTAGATETTLETLDGLHDIETDRWELLAAAPRPNTRLIGSVMFVPPVLFAVTWIALAIVQRNASDPARRRRQNALRAARRRVQDTRDMWPREKAVALSAALAGYLADRLNEPPARFTGQTAVDYLRRHNIREDVVEQWQATVSQCDEASFAPGDETNADALKQATLTCLELLEREKL